MREFGPKPANHPSIGESCPVCGIKFREDDMTTLREIEPADKEERIKKEQGRAYTARAEEVHSVCIGLMRD